MPITGADITDSAHLMRVFVLVSIPITSTKESLSVWAKTHEKAGEADLLLAIVEKLGSRISGNTFRWHDTEMEVVLRKERAEDGCVEVFFF